MFVEESFVVFNMFALYRNIVLFMTFEVSLL